jgi:hypothetical protein
LFFNRLSIRPLVDREGKVIYYLGRAVRHHRQQLRASGEGDGSTDQLICDWVMSRPQIQEEAVMQLANILQDKVKPDGLAIVIEADHFCMHWRGVKDADARMTNSVMRGSFLKDRDLRREFLSLLSNR